MTGHFASLQAVLGFSITNALEPGRGGYFANVRPIFGKPINSLRCDVFVLMPFEQAMRPVYEDHVKIVCELMALSCQRADDFLGARQVMHDIWSAISMSQCVIADCTGRNPNVFYEMGIAHTLGKPVVLITQREEDVHFDIRHMRYIKYDYTPRGVKGLEKDLKSMLQAQFAK